MKFDGVTGCHGDDRARRRWHANGISRDRLAREESETMQRQNTNKVQRNNLGGSRQKRWRHRRGTITS